jgi:hypothetical protein
MLRRTARLLAFAGALLIAFAVGTVSGYRRGLIVGLGHLENRLAATLATDVELASCVREGDTQRALGLLDLSVDSLVLQLDAGQANVGYVATDTLPSTQDSLSVAKVYRSLVPSTGQDAAAVHSALAAASGTPALSLSPALARLASRAAN